MTAKAVLKRTTAGAYCWHLKSAGNHTLYVSEAFAHPRDCAADRAAFLATARAAQCEDDRGAPA